MSNGAISNKGGNNLKDIAGLKFGRLYVERRVENTRAGKARWMCMCECGAQKEVTGGNLISGQISSCGCLRSEKTAARAHARSFKHGHASRDSMTGEYRSYRAMLSRCLNPNSTGFHRYGGRGIKVCDRWLNGDVLRSGFECFVSDMGERPSKNHSIDRFPNGDGDYEPGNCRWATPKQQGGNGHRKPELTVIEDRQHAEEPQQEQ